MTQPQPPKPERKPVLVPIRQQRPDPPASLSAAEAEIWRTTVRSMRADWFIGAVPQVLLRAYCVQCVLAIEIERRLRAMWRKRIGGDDAGYREVLRQHIECCKTMLRLATSLRLTPLSNRQSVRDARVVAPERWPWER
jgi:phage terminase small subunit